MPVFVVVGTGARDAVQDLRLREELLLVDAPRQASVLFIAGGVPESHAAAILTIHDALSHPRATVWWKEGASPGGLGAIFHEALFTEEDPAAAISCAHRELLAGERRSEAALLPDVDPAAWRGVGPYGQGGSGMTGGVPYGRPLVDRAPDRDGLTLDQLPLRLGPYLAPLPPGLTLDVLLQGDVLQSVEVVEPRPLSPLPGRADDPFQKALHDPVQIAELELARARSHLRWLSSALYVQGLEALSLRVLRLAGRITPKDGDAVRTLERRLRRTGVISWATAGVGVIGPRELEGLGAGPVARAAGLADDVRAEDPSYRSLGFEPVVGRGGDLAARWLCRLAEVSQSLDIAARAERREGSVRGEVESPRGRLTRDSRPSSRLLPALPRLLEGEEWGDAVAALVSLDLDLDGVRAAAGLHEQGGAR